MIVKFSKINGGWLAVIESNTGDVIEHGRFRDLDDAGNWASNFCEGYAKALTLAEKIIKREVED